MTTYRVQGLDQLRANFLAFPKELAKRALNQALAKGAEPIRAQAQALAPVRTGHLQAVIAIAKDKKPGIAGMDARYVVFVPYKGPQAALYWRYDEFGTSKMAPRAFMRPAFELQKFNALRLIYQHLSDAAPRIANSLSK